MEVISWPLAIMIVAGIFYIGKKLSDHQTKKELNELQNTAKRSDSHRNPRLDKRPRERFVQPSELSDEELSSIQRTDSNGHIDVPY